MTNKPFTPEDDDAFGPLNQLTRMLNDHDERGLVLTLAAFADEALAKLIQTFLLPVKESEDLLTGFNAPLGTFSSRIKACYALGLINEEQFKDLEYLRKIRNAFAHAWEEVSLEQDKLKSYVQNMSFSYLDTTFPETSVEKVKSSISALLADISSMTHQMNINDTRVKVSGTRLLPLVFRGELSEQIQQAQDLWNTISTQYHKTTGEHRKFWVRRLEHLRLQIPLLLGQVSDDMKPQLLMMFLEVEKLLGSNKPL